MLRPDGVDVVLQVPQPALVGLVALTTVPIEMVDDFLLAEVFGRVG